jgi:hypothetical protein
MTFYLSSFSFVLCRNYPGIMGTCVFQAITAAGKLASAFDLNIALDPGACCYFAVISLSNTHDRRMADVPVRMDL